MVLGAHVSIAGGVANAPQNGLNVPGCEAIQIFAKNQRQWKAKPYSPSEIQAFKDNYKASNLQGVMVHASYLINTATADRVMWTKGRDGLLDELQRCDQLGIPYLNIHPGSHVGSGVEAGIRKIAEALEWVLTQTEGSKTMILLEFMAGQGTNLGDKFQDLNTIRSLVAPNKRVGYCFDTCHLFAAGKDITKPDSYKQVMKRADEVLGIQNIKAFHLNDSKMPLKSHVDRHENIGKGLMGVEGFRPLLQDPRFKDHPMFLETPMAEEGYPADLKALRTLL